MTLPYQIERTRLSERSDYQPHDSDIVYYRYDLINLATGRVVAYSFTSQPVPPKRLRHRQAELNTRHCFDKLN
jgi:hypothetical protein